MPAVSCVTVVLAVKRLDDAKSRLRPAVRSDTQRCAVVAAMLADTLAAAVGAGVGGLTVVSPDPRVHRLTVEAGGTALDEPAPVEELSPLNAALTHGIAGVAVGVVAALQADLAALDSGTLCAALAEAVPVIDDGAPAVFVADRVGDGTALLVVRAGSRFVPRFGPGSAAAHRDAGAVELDPERRRWPRLRTDVDTPADLSAAVALGVGARTAAVVSAAGIAPSRPLRDTRIRANASGGGTASRR